MAKTSDRLAKIVLGIMFAFALVPGAALASGEVAQIETLEVSDVSDTDEADDEEARAAEELRQQQELEEQLAEQKKQNYTIEFDRSLIDTIGTQEQTGHTICCPSFSCAYADAVLDGTLHDHEYYSCSECMWTDWGGGGSAYRSLGSDEELLREAYDQIAAGRPTVIHVSYSYGEHWTALIGYQNATDPNHLTLDNFVALDPWDGAQITASERFSLYGDACEHVSER